MELERTEAQLSLGREAGRKALHLSTAVVPVFYAMGLAKTAVVELLGSAAVLALVIEIWRRSSSRAREIFEHTGGMLLRGHEHESLTGATWLVVSCLAVVLLLPRPAAIATLWCAAAGDPAATLAGRSYRAARGPLDGYGKSAIGSAGCLLISFFGAWKLAHFSFSGATMIAAAATLAERAPGPIDDNVRVSVAAGAVAWLLS